MICRLDRRRRLAHGHLDAAEILGFVVRQSPLASLLADDELPGVGILHQRIERIVALWHVETADIEIGIGVKGGRRVRAGAPDGISGSLRQQSAVSENLAAAHRWRRVLDADRLASHSDGRLGARALLSPSQSAGTEHAW